MTTTMPRKRSWHGALSATLSLSAAALLSAACGSAATDEERKAAAESNRGAVEGSEVLAEHDLFTLQEALELQRQPADPPPRQQLAVAQSSVIWTRWTKGEAQKSLSPFSTHICGLAMVRGEFTNDTNLRIVRSGSNWAMRGENPGDNTLEMDAVCIPYSAFQVDAGSTVTSTDSFGAVVTNDNSEKIIPMPLGSVPVLTGVWGHFEGGGERSRITMVPTLEAKKGTQNSAQAAYASALSFGLPARELPFITDEAVSRSQSYVPVIVGCDGSADFCEFGTDIAPLDSSFCYLSSVSGDFNGADEWIQVYPRFADGTWRMQGFAETGNGVFARAECVDLNQKRRVIGPGPLF